MELPQKVQEFIDQKIHNKKLTSIKQSYLELSNKYRLKKRQDYINNSQDVLAYSLSRMLDTFCVNCMVSQELKNVLELNNTKKQQYSLLDVGSGTMSANIAFNEYFDLSSICCVEQNKYMADFAKELSESCGIKASIIQKDMKSVDMPKSDIVVASFCLNELTEKDMQIVVNRLVQATQKYLVIVEAGTPKSFELMKQIKNIILSQNMYLISPCCCDECNMPPNDWCHFFCRTNRSKELRYLKGGEEPYEDEKYTYYIFSKDKQKRFDNRIISRIQKPKNQITFRACTNQGIKDYTITPKNKETYKQFKKKKCGDVF